MPLTPGQQIAHYRITHKLGEGGMGEVWAATDTRLNRPAAIKALPQSLAGDSERLARFKREAQFLASLNHPNIAAIYGLEEADGTPYLALELVEGDDLSVRIAQNPIPPDEAVELAAQIAAALEEAHDKGIVHRDLKPANVKVTPDGKVKVLDFGLAKAFSGDPLASGTDASLSMSPTMTATMGGTQAGFIMGTASYMAPEQARGKPVDRRADIWAFGVVLFEMLTGERMYTGETVTDVIAQVVTREPAWEKLPAGTPALTRRLLRRCLQKDPRRRLRDIGDAQLDLTEDPHEDAGAEQAAPDATGPTRRPWLLGVAGILLGLIAGVIIQNVTAPATPPQRATWSALLAPQGSQYDFGAFQEISPDGRHVTFVAPAPEGDGSDVLWVRDLDADRARALAGTEDAWQPFWSPDSRFIGYFARRKLRKVSVDGGVSTSICDIGTDPRGGTWGQDGAILFVPDWSQPVFRVADTGGTPEQVTELSPERLELSHRWPRFLPDGRHFLFYAVSTYPALNPQNPSQFDESGLYIGSLDGEEPRLLHTARSRARYEDGWLLFVDDSILTARPFNLGRLEFDGEPVSLVEGVTQTVASLWGGALFSASDEGTLIFVRGASERRGQSQLVWRDRQGEEIGRFGGPAEHVGMRLSHDGRRAVVAIGDPSDLWMLDLARGITTRFTFDPGNDISPQWSPDDRQIIFQSSRVIPGQGFAPANLMTRLASGREGVEHVTSPEGFSQPTDWSPDGRVVLLDGMNPGKGLGLMLYSFDDDSMQPFVDSEFNEESGRFSPDGRWVAYESDESGREEIYIQSFPEKGGKWQISNTGGSLPLWRADGKELFYMGLEGEVMAVPLEVEGGLQPGGPVKLFDVDAAELFDDTLLSYEVTSDGQRFLFLEPVTESPDASATLTLVQNWRVLLE